MKSNNRKSVNFLPDYFRTEKNKRFLSATLDQFIQPPQIERLSSYVGSKITSNYKPETDFYLDDDSSVRSRYQLLPSLLTNSSNKVISYIDLINQLKFYGSKVENLSKVFASKSYSYDPCIDWDKFINFREYYWLPTGPDTVEISGTIKETITTYNVVDSSDGNSLLFGTDSEIPSTVITLYRGNTYVFNVNSQYPFYIKTAFVSGPQSLYSKVTGQGTTTGQVVLTIDESTPNILFYFAEGNQSAVGQFSVKEFTENSSLNVETDILGKKYYTSGNNVQLSNGLKIKFSGNVIPETYLNKEYIVEGVGSSIKLVDFKDLKSSVSNLSELDVDFDATPFDQYPFDDFEFIPLTPEYLTINKASPDLNPWSRYNRWFHKDIIVRSAKLNGVELVLDAELRAKRPIVEFIPGLQLYNFGSTAKRNVDLIDNTTRNAFRSFEGKPGFYIDNVLVQNGFRVIFNADDDADVRGKIYQVKFTVINGKEIVNLEETDDSAPLLKDAVVSIRGNEYQGTSWWFDGNKWVLAQQKTELNQPPLFDIYDDDGISLGDRNFYNTSFKGTKVFNYSIGTGSNDLVLGFPLKYQNIANVGDYVFDNYFINDTFTEISNGVLSTKLVSSYYLKVNEQTDFLYRDVWTEQSVQQMAIIQYEVLNDTVDFLEINSIKNPGFDTTLKIVVLVNDQLLEANTDYVISRKNSQAFVVSNKFVKDSRVLIKLYSANPPTDTGYYEAPVILTNNPLNSSIGNSTFSELTEHMASVFNMSGFKGEFPGSNNIRDLSGYAAYGSKILVHKNPISFAHYFMSNDHNLISALRTASVHYNQFKLALINQISKVVYSPDSKIMLDQALKELNQNKDKNFPYYYSDMVPCNSSARTREIIVTGPTNSVFGLSDIFNDSVLSNRAVLVYLNNSLLIKDTDYVFDKFSPSVIVNKSLVKGDKIKIVEYKSTIGNFVPPTPTKLGLYPKYTPKKYIDDTYISGPTEVIQGHDGSITVAFGDYRDNIILEFETRIYNNLKETYNSDLFDFQSILPGAFRNTEYSLDDINSILSVEFLNWTGTYGIDYTENLIFDESNPFTYNYSQNIDSINKRKLPGFWRGIYSYFYGTDRPHTHPWEMVGFTEKPDWWDSRYGPAPYTKDNLILWDDLEHGRYQKDGVLVIDQRYTRPGLHNIIPVDESGNLLSPSECNLATTPILNPEDPNKFINLRSESIASDWKFGDFSPAETAWRKSSFWPFAVQILSALLKPADYCASMFNPSAVIKNKIGQIKTKINNQFLSLLSVDLYSDTTADSVKLASGYNVYMIETGSVRNKNYLDILKTDLANLEYKLTFKLGGFANKNKLRLNVDGVDLKSQTPGVLVPSEDFAVILNKSAPIDSIGVSGIIIQKLSNGYKIKGYDQYNPYFYYFKSVPSQLDPVTQIGGRSASYTNWRAGVTYDETDIVFYQDRYYQVTQKHLSTSIFNSASFKSLPYLPTVNGVPIIRRSKFDNSASIMAYGTVLETIQDVYDFIIGYGKWLTSKGCIFDEFNADIGQILDWTFSANEYVFWTTQNWNIDAVITLSPFANRLKFISSTSVVDSLVDQFYRYSVLNADGSLLSKEKFSVSRSNGEFNLETNNTRDGIYFVRLNLVQKEHEVVLNNTTIFNDVIYDPIGGYRQVRLKINGYRTRNWDGDLSSPGFVFDQANVSDWKKFTSYKVGDVVRFSGKYYSANKSLAGSNEFNLLDWKLLDKKPEAALLPNFEYKIDQIEDFYSLDIDNFDTAQQAMAQQLTGYIPRSYLSAIVNDPTAQYKFYQGYIKEKGTKNPLIKIQKSSSTSSNVSLDFSEEWALRIGSYGGITTHEELEIQLTSEELRRNPGVYEITDSTVVKNDINRKTVNDIVITPSNFDSTSIFPTTTSSADTIITLPVAGYVRFDDVNATAYNKVSILDIANNNVIEDGTFIWLGFREDDSWDVLRYTQIPTVITNVELFEVGQSLLVTTEQDHTVNAGEIVSVTRINEDIDQCYIVTEVISPTQFTVSSDLISLPALDETLSGVLFSFKSARVSGIADIANIPLIEKWNIGDKLWIDNVSGKWVVYEKINNYTEVNVELPITVNNQHYGYNILNFINTGTLISFASDYINIDDNTKGRAFVLNALPNDNFDPTLSVSINDGNTYFQSTLTTGFGFSAAGSIDGKKFVVSAPYTSNIKGTFSNSEVNLSTSFSGISNQGLVKIYKLDDTLTTVVSSTVLTSLTPTVNGNYGHSLVITDSGNKLYVSEPGISTTGSIYQYSLTFNTSTILVNLDRIIYGEQAQSRYGEHISGNSSLSRYAVSAPGFVTSGTISNSPKGAVYVYDTTVNTSTYVQKITGLDLDLPEVFGPSDVFGSKVLMSDNGEFLAVASPQSYNKNTGSKTGVIDLFKWSVNKFTHIQRLMPPTGKNIEQFGYNLDFDKFDNSLIVSCFGNVLHSQTSFGQFSERLPPSEAEELGDTIYINNENSLEFNSPVTFDSNTVQFYDVLQKTGTVFVYDYLNGKWVYNIELINPNNSSGCYYGHSIAANNYSIVVGSPSLENTVDNGVGNILIFKKKNNLLNGWKILREQDDLVDLKLIKNSFTLDKDSYQIRDYIDIIDPIKGSIPGVVQQELKLISQYDPAVYSIGTNFVNVNPNLNWLDDRVGHLWWDLSTVKYVWHEQGDIEYRKNNWNTFFPGSTIDIYEWVESRLLPSEWSAVADTPEGIAQGISGQPKFIDNSVISVKQVYDSISNSFTNVYYYWVKNKNTLPLGVSNRRRSALEVARILADPIGSGEKIITLLSKNSFMLGNISSVDQDMINLNLSFNSMPNDVSIHNEWLLMQEGDRRSLPTAQLEKKLFDSIIGRDSLGNPVPDPSLPEKQKYGIEIRPRQSMFKNKIEALRNIVEFANSVLIKEQITGNYNFSKLNSKNEKTDLSIFDQIIENIFDLEAISTVRLRPALLTANIDSNGKISSVNIDDSGFGYVTPPTVKVENSEVELITEINSLGEVIGVQVKNGGSNFETAPELVVRPYTVLVQTDRTINGMWAVYAWDSNLKKWNRIETQTFDTTLYWKYVDWTSDNFISSDLVDFTVNSTYQINEYFDMPEGTRVKVLNSGNGNSIILRKVSSNGTFNSDWDIDYIENGTIQILDTLWNPDKTFYGFDEVAGFDETKFDQTPEQEILNILHALKDDLFINDLKVNWNKLFFVAVKYALSEQKFLDWVFKTTFVNAVVDMGELDQPSKYNLVSSTPYENFLEEIKPYHTQIREFTERYSSIEPSGTVVTDFDLPSYFNEETQQYETVRFGNPLLLDDERVSWYNNFSLSLTEIKVVNGGKGYYEVPTVQIIPASGDTGFGAIATARISAGKIIGVDIINPGVGYTSIPKIVLVGGGPVTEAAVLTPVMANKKVRTNNLTLKFDRVGTKTEIGNTRVTDRFISDGVNLVFNLSWAPKPEKEEIILKVNGVLKMYDDFTIEYYTEDYNPEINTNYNKKYARLNLLFSPAKFDVIEIEYPKHLEFFTAVDRIENFYLPQAGMPGKYLNQLMSGVDYSGLSIDTIPFSFNGGWDVIPFSSAGWDGFTAKSTTARFVTTETSTQTFKLKNVSLTTGTELNVYIDSNRIDSAEALIVPTLYAQGTFAVDSIEIVSPGAGYVSSLTSVAISAPRAGGVQAIATASIVNGEISSISIVNKGSGYLEAPAVTIIGPSTTIARAVAAVVAEFTSSNNTQTFVDIVIPAGSSTFVNTVSNIVFRQATDDGSLDVVDPILIDSTLSGGKIDYSDAEGIRPEELILDGGSSSTRHITGMIDDGFLNLINGNAPEECVPGTIKESLGINLYDQADPMSPLISSKVYYYDGSQTTFNLGVRPSSNESVIISLNNVTLKSHQYTVDFSSNTVTLDPLELVAGWLNIVTIQTGGLKLIGYFVEEVLTTGTYLTSVAFKDIGSLGSSTYVTSNGNKITQGIDYTVEDQQSRAKFTFYTTGTIQAFIFNGSVKDFSEVKSQFVTITEETSSLTLDNPPGVSGPLHDQVIVLRNNNRLLPPSVSRAVAVEGVLEYNISEFVEYPTNSIATNLIEVYINGILTPQSNVWSFNSELNQIVFTPNRISAGDRLAFVVLENYEYTTYGNEILLTSPALINDEFEIITFNNHDSMSIMTNKFSGSSLNRYKLPRKLVDASYAWVSYNGINLVPNLDFSVDNDGYTITLNSSLYKGTSDTVLITSFAERIPPTSSYRIFKDLIGRTHYLRLSSENSTVLSSALYSTSTKIVVANANALTMPDPFLNRPGVVLIDGERIEFLEINGNELGKLRRATLGTNIKDVYSTGTLVIDQGIDQNIPVVDYIETTSTIITTSTQTVFDLSNMTFNSEVNISDQIEVKYGGRTLIKPGVTTYSHDFDKSYDSLNDNLVQNEFYVNTSSMLTLTFEPQPGVRLEIITRKSRVFDQNAIDFIQEKPALSLDKYRYEQR